MEARWLLISTDTNQKIIHGEGPHWDQSSQCLYSVDIVGKKIIKTEYASQKSSIISLDEMVGFVVPIESGELIAALQSGIYKVDELTNKFELITEVEPNKPNNRPNDGKSDPEGRLWIGTMDLDLSEGASSLYRMDQAHNPDLQLDGLTLSNGLDWDRNLNIFYFIDSLSQCIDAFDYDPVSGSITNRHTVINIPKENGLPDGMCIDVEGMLWVSLFGGGAVKRYNPNSGECIATISIPTKYPTSCAFAGPSLNELWVTTSNLYLNDEEKLADANAGNLYIVETNTKGYPGNSFKI